ncbi:MAG: MltA domain-containing protein, partial [Oricola sp.]
MWTLRPLAFSELAGWAADDHSAALRAFARHAHRPVGETYRAGAAGVHPERLEPLFAEAGTAAAQADPRDFFERNFYPCRLVDTQGGRGFVTAFYEPEIEASRVKTGAFDVPFHRRPDDLVAVTEDNRPFGWEPDIRFARKAADGTLLAYPDRAAINAGWLEGRELEIAWVESAVDA